MACGLSSCGGRDQQDRAGFLPAREVVEIGFLEEAACECFPRPCRWRQTAPGRHREALRIVRRAARDIPPGRARRSRAGRPAGRNRGRAGAFLYSIAALRCSAVDGKEPKRGLTSGSGGGNLKSPRPRRSHAKNCRNCSAGVCRSRLTPQVTPLTSGILTNTKYRQSLRTRAVTPMSRAADHVLSSWQPTYGYLRRQAGPVRQSNPAGHVQRQGDGPCQRDRHRSFRQHLCRRGTRHRRTFHCIIRCKASRSAAARAPTRARAF